MTGLLLTERKIVNNVSLMIQMIQNWFGSELLSKGEKKMAGNGQVYQAKCVDERIIKGRMSLLDSVRFLGGSTLADSYIKNDNTTELDDDEIVDRTKRMEPFYAEAKKIFCSMFGLPENTEVTRSMVQQGMQQMLVDGESYQEAFNIKDADEKNYDFILCHMVQNVTRGEIANSFYNGEPKQVIVLGNGLGNIPGLEENSVCRAIIPPAQNIIVPKPPKPLNGWQRFWGVFGLYKKEREQFAQETQRYEAAVAEQTAARERQEQQTAAAETYAANVERKLKEESLSQKAQKKIKKTFQNQEIREKLHEAAVEAKKGIHNSDRNDMIRLLYYLTNGKKLDERDAPDKTKDEEAYNKYFGKKESDLTSIYTTLLAGSGRSGSIIHQISMYMMTFKGVSLDQMTQGIASMKENPISEKGIDFVKSMRTAAKEYGEIMGVEKGSEVTSEKKQRAAQTIAAMYRKFGEFQMNEIDPLNPEDIKQKATNNMMLERLGMDLGQMRTNKSEMEGLINDELKKTETENDRNFETPLKHCTSMQLAAKVGCIDSVCSLYASEDFKDREVKSEDSKDREVKGDDSEDSKDREVKGADIDKSKTFNHLDGVLSRIVISQNACGNVFAGKPMQEYSREVVLEQLGITTLLDVKGENKEKAVNLLLGKEVPDNVLQFTSKGLHKMVPNHIQKVKSTLSQNGRTRINQQQLEESIDRQRGRQQPERRQSIQRETNQVAPRGMGGR